MSIHFKIIQEEKGFYTFCVEFPGCQTQADTIEDLLYNISERLTFCSFHKKFMFQIGESNSLLLDVGH